MQFIVDTVCSVVSFLIVSSVLISVLPNQSGLKKAISVLSGVICIIMILPLTKADVSDFEIDINTAQQTSDINNMLNDRIELIVKSDIIQKSAETLKKHGVNLATVTLDAEILDESGILVRNVNYIIKDNLLSGESLERELQELIGYNCKIISEVRNE